MLLKYIVNNFKSIGHSVEFSMIPTENNTDERFLTTIKTKQGDLKVLKRGGFFGPNASGKSTFIESIKFAKEYIIEGQRSNKSTGVSQFKGNIEELGNTTLFQFLFYLDENIYEYGFSLTSKRVVEEWLMIQTQKGFAPMFVRATDSEANTEIDIAPNFNMSNSKDMELATVLKDSIKESQKNQLFLYKLKENGVKFAENIVRWFEGIQIIFPHSKIKWLPMRVDEDDELKEFLSKALRNLDTGVFSIKAEKNEINFHEFAEKLELSKEIIEEIENNKSGVISIGGKYYIFFEKEEKTVLIMLRFEHKLNNNATNFDIDDESDGTKRLLDLLPILFRMDKKNTTIYFVDEIDRSLHTKLTKFLLKTFMKESEGLLNQFIFTAHDVNLINLNDFSKEEIWFIEKNNLGETTLKPFSDFETTENQDLVKGYLNGRFGAIPVIKGE